MTRSRNAYEEDFVARLEDQAQRARRGETDGLDLENIAEELEGMARSDRPEIRNRLTVLLVHLLKYLAQPRRRSSGRLSAIAKQRIRIATVIDDSPSLGSFRESILDQCHADALLLRRECPKAPSGTTVPSLRMTCSIRLGCQVARGRRHDGPGGAKFISR